MPRFETDPQLQALAEALAALRRDRGLSQAEAGARLGMTSQGWGLYEAGRRAGLHRPDVQRRLLAALDATPEELALRLGGPGFGAAASDRGVESPGRAFAAAPGQARERLTLTDDGLAPWAASGVVLDYAPGRWPRRDQGCVVELADGRILARLYVGADADRVRLRGGPGGLEAEQALARAEIRRLSAVMARLEAE